MVLQRKRVVLLGKGTLAIHAADWFHTNPAFELECIVPVIPEPSWTDSLSDWAIKNKVSIIESGRYEDIPGVRENGRTIDLAFSVFYDKIIKDWFIKKCDKILNLHNSPLPHYRGVSPINWALKNNENEHGITIHEIIPGIDAGPVVAQLKYSIYPKFDEVVDVYTRSLAYGAILFDQTMPLVYKITPMEQEHAQATYYSKEQNELLGERKNFTKEQSV